MIIFIDKSKAHMIIIHNGYLLLIFPKYNLWPNKMKKKKNEDRVEP